MLLFVAQSNCVGKKLKTKQATPLAAFGHDSIVQTLLCIVKSAAFMPVLP